MKKTVCDAFNNQAFTSYVINIAFFIAYFLILTYGYTYRFRDDIIFLNMTTNQSSIMAYIFDRYATWSSRILIEAIVAVFSMLPLSLFRLFFSFLMSQLCWYYCRIQSSPSLVHTLIIHVLFLLFPLFYLSDTGFISTGLFYVLPFWGLLIGLVPLTNQLKNRSIKIFDWVLYFVGSTIASNFEMTAVLLFSLSLLLNIYLLFLRKKPFIYAFIISFTGIIFSITCPGNKIRTAIEIENNLPEYTTWSFSDKIINGIFHGLLTAFANSEVKFFILALLLVAMAKNINNIKKIMITLISFFFVLLSSFLDQIFPDIFTQDFHSLYEGTVSDNIYLCLLLLAFFSCITTLYIAFDIIKDSIIYSLIYLAGACSCFIIGFSPTIIASGYRVFNFMIFGIIFCIAGIIKSTVIINNKQIIPFIPIGLIVMRMAILNIQYIENLRLGSMR